MLICLSGPMRAVAQADKIDIGVLLVEREVDGRS